MRTLALLALLLATAFVPLAGASDSSAALCYNYLYVADYQWHYVCVDPRGGTCAVYTYRSNGVVNSPRDCVVDPPTGTAAGPEPCTRLFTDLDYSTWLCVDKTNAGCPVWLERRSGGTVTGTTCVGPGGDASAPLEVACIPTSGGLDYHSFLCIDGGNLRCPVYTLHSTDSGTVKTCVPPHLP